MRQGDVTIAKNYLNEKEMEQLNRIVTITMRNTAFAVSNFIVVELSCAKKRWGAKLKLKNSKFVERAI